MIILINSLFETAKTVITMAETQRYALVTGAKKGIGFQICRQLACKGIMVVLASRDEKRGIEARKRMIEELGSVSDNEVVFHQLDVVDTASIAAVAEFVESKFGRLDILVNNAGILGADINGDVLAQQDYSEADLKLLAAGGGKEERFDPKANGILAVETLEGAKECIETNYYGAKRVTEALIPLLQKSDSPRIPNEWAKGVLSSEDSSLNEEKVEEVLQQFLKDFKESKLQENQWPPHVAAYKVSKTAMNAYTRVIAKKHPSFCINAVCPGFIRTDITCNIGLYSEAEGAEAPVKLALLPHGGPSRFFFTRDEALSL